MQRSKTARSEAKGPSRRPHRWAAPCVYCMLHRVARGVLAGVRRGSEARGAHPYGQGVVVTHCPGLHAQRRRLLSTAETAVFAVAGAAQPFRWMGRGLVGLGLGSGAAAAALALTTPQADGVDLDIAHVDLRPPTLGELVPRAAVLCLLFCPLLLLAPLAVAFPDRLRDLFFRLLTYTLAQAGPAFIKWGQVRATLFPACFWPQGREERPTRPALLPPATMTRPASSCPCVVLP